VCKHCEIPSSCVCEAVNFVDGMMLLQINVPTDIDGMDLMAEKVDRKQLVDLLKHMLMLDQERRIKPDEALNHPFQTMSYLLDYVHCTTYDNNSLCGNLVLSAPCMIPMSLCGNLVLGS